MLSNSNTGCFCNEIYKCTWMLLSGSFIPTQPWFGYYRLQVWTPKLNLSLPSRPRTRPLPKIYFIPRGLRAESSILKTLTAQHLLGLPVHPSIILFISDSINLVLPLVKLPLLEALYIHAVPIVCFLLNKHLFAFSTVKQCWLKQGWMWCPFLSNEGKSALEKHSALCLRDPDIFRGAWVVGWASSRLSVACLERLVFYPTLDVTVMQKTTGMPALRELWGEQAGNQTHGHNQTTFQPHCHLWNAFPGNFIILSTTPLT